MQTHPKKNWSTHIATIAGCGAALCQILSDPEAFKHPFVLLLAAATVIHGYVTKGI